LLIRVIKLTYHHERFPRGVATSKSLSRRRRLHHCRRVYHSDWFGGSSGLGIAELDAAPVIVLLLADFPVASRVLISEQIIDYRVATMIKGSEVRKADHQIEPFLLDRWSPRAMSGEEISHEELMRLFEAARWAPSSFKTRLMPNSNALDPQSPQARAIYDLAIHSTVFVPCLFITTFLVILLVKLWMA
jgi:hypothetical protein